MLFKIVLFIQVFLSLSCFCVFSRAALEEEQRGGLTPLSLSKSIDTKGVFGRGENHFHRK